MIPLLPLLLLALALAYAGALLYLKKGLARLTAGANKTQPLMSVLIAARDEEENIEDCLRCVLGQNYPAFEVIVIDDRSSDGTPAIVSEWQERYPNLRLLQIRDDAPGMSPKKRALQLGIEQSRGEIIVTTDADCLPGPNWLAGLARHFDPKVGLVAGYNPYVMKDGPASLFHEALALDYFAMAAVAAASAGLGFPLSCSAGNLAYRRRVYEKLGGFGKPGALASGDDDLFMQRVREETRWRLRDAVSPAPFVSQAPPEGLRDFLQQRFRYASKGRAYSGPVVAGLAGVFLLNLALALGLALSLIVPEMLSWVIPGFLLKAAAEFAFLRGAGRVFGHGVSLGIFALTATAHPFYLVIAVLGGQFGGFEWKGRSFSASR